MILAHKIELEPNQKQVISFKKACGCARFAYNWGLEKWKEMYEKYKIDNTLPKPSAFLIKKEFNKIKETQFPWIYESPKDANQQSFTNLGIAFNKFFKKQSKFPKKHKKGIKDSFYVSNDQIKLTDSHIKIPLIGNVKLTESLRFNGYINSVTISNDGDKWFASISVDSPNYSKPFNENRNESIGIDLGINKFITTSNNESYDAPKPLKKNLRKLKRLQRRLSKSSKNSNNRKKKRQKLKRLHFKIKSIRNDFIHKLTTKLCRENQTICLENLAVKNMIRNPKLSKSISDVSWSEFSRQLNYKKDIFKNNLCFVDRFYPSSKTCSCCGFIKKDLKLSDRTFRCTKCNSVIDRDFNASININRVGLTQINARGHGTSIKSSDLVSSVVEP